MKKLTLILSAVIVVAFAGSAFASVNIDTFGENETETDARYFVETAIGTGDLISYMNRLPEAFDGERPADAKSLLKSSLNAGPNKYYAEPEDNA